MEAKGSCPPVSHKDHQYYGEANSNHLIIFVHGFCGDAKTTWVNNTNGFNFPDQLEKDLAAEGTPAYVISFNYVSNLEVAPSIIDIAKRLSFKIQQLMQNHEYKEISFVAHSMGGIIARQYILRHQPLELSTSTRVDHLVLLGSPTNGAQMADLGEKLLLHNRQIAELRNVDQGNSFLEALNDQWSRHFVEDRTRYILMAAAYETVPMLLDRKLVQFSSTIHLASENMGFSTNHIGLSKPIDKNDDIYQWVKAKLKQSLRQKIKQQFERMKKHLELSRQDISKPPEIDSTMAPGLSVYSRLHSANWLFCKRHTAKTTRDPSGGNTQNSLGIILGRSRFVQEEYS